MSNNENLEYAGFWVRVGAALLDSVMLLLITVPLMLMIYGDAVREFKGEVGQFDSADALVKRIFTPMS